MHFDDPQHPLAQTDNLRRAIDAAGVALWSWNVTDDQFAMDERGFRLWGLPYNREVKFEDLSAHIHPADRDRVRDAFTATRGIVGAYEIDFRILVARRSGGFPRVALVTIPPSTKAICSESFWT